MEKNDFASDFAAAIFALRGKEIAMNVLSPIKMSIDAFFDWAEYQEGKFELVDGVPRLLPYVKLNHNRIVTNLVVLLAQSTDRQFHEVATGDFAVQVGPQTIRYADVMVLPSGKQGSLRCVSDALLLVEVLSPSTMHVDFGAKLDEYRALGKLDTYLILSQDEPQIWQWTRDDEGNWPTDPLRTTEGSISVAKFGVEMTLEDIYRGVN